MNFKTCSPKVWLATASIIVISRPEEFQKQNKTLGNDRVLSSTGSTKKDKSLIFIPAFFFLMEGHFNIEIWEEQNWTKTDPLKLTK